MAELIAEKVPICGSRDVDPDGGCHWQTNSRHIEPVTHDELLARGAALLRSLRR